MSVKYYPAPLRFRPKQTKQPAEPKADDTGAKPTPKKKAKK